MIQSDKYENSLYALQGILIKARDLAYQSDDGEMLAKLLDYAEYLPRLIASKEDNTNIFEDMIQEIAENFDIAFVADRYNKEIPESW